MDGYELETTEIKTEYRGDDEARPQLTGSIAQIVTLIAKFCDCSTGSVVSGMITHGGLRNKFIVKYKVNNKKRKDHGRNFETSFPPCKTTNEGNIDLLDYIEWLVSKVAEKESSLGTDKPKESKPVARKSVPKKSSKEEDDEQLEIDGLTTEERETESVVDEIEASLGGASVSEEELNDAENAFK